MPRSSCSGECEREREALGGAARAQRQRCGYGTWVHELGWDIALRCVGGWGTMVGLGYFKLKSAEILMLIPGRFICPRSSKRQCAGLCS